MATHSSTLAWKIPWTEGPGGLQSMGLLGVRHDWATWLSLFTSMHWRRKWQPTPVLLPGESQGRGAWWAAIYGVTQSWIRLKRLSSSSSKNKAGRLCTTRYQDLFGEGKGNPLQYSCLENSTDRAIWRATVYGVLKGWTGRGKGNPLQYSCLENPTDRGGWQATVYGVARVGHD